MTFVLNKCYGGFCLSKFAVEHLGIPDQYSFEPYNEQMVDALASLIREYGWEKCSGSLARLEVVEIPDNCTDYTIQDYDGVETIVYVVDGKLHFA